MALSNSDIIKSRPIGGGLNDFHDLYNTTRTDIPELSDAVGHMHIGDEAARLLPSSNGRGTLLGDLSRFNSVVDSGDFDLRSAVPLLAKVLNKAPDADIWDAVYGLVTESTPPPRPLPYPNQTPISFNTGSLANTSEYRKHFDGALRDELDSSLHIDIPNFFDTFFGELINLESVAGAVFKKFQEHENPLYKEGEGGGWRDWPEDAQEEKVLKWFKERIDIFLEFAKESGSTPEVRRRPLGQRALECGALAIL